ncbi:MAG: PKD domain-containing protein, partial [Saprospirales bacterium]
EVELDGSASSQGAEFSYLWTTSDGNILSGEESLNPLVNAAGTYQLQVTNNDNGCISASSIEVISDGEFPELELNKSGDISCLDNVVLLSGLGSASGDNISYSWENSDGEIISDELEVNISVGGQYLFSVINNDNGCISIESVVVEEDIDLPIATAEVEGTLTCILNTIEIDGSGSSQGAEFNYLWTTEDGDIERGDSTLFPLVGSAGSYTLLVVNTITGCENEFSIDIEEIRDEPEAEYDFESENLSVSFSNLSENGQTYLWDFGDGNTSDEAEPEHVFDVHGEYEICLTVTNDCGEDVICNTVLVVYSSVSTSPNVRNVSCFEGNDGFIQLEVTGNSPFKFDWSNGAEGQNLSELEAGEYTVTITDGIGLTSELTFEINQPDLIELNEVNIVDVIAGEPGSISVEVKGGVEPYSYSWSNGADEASISNLDMGEYTLTVTDDNECEVIFGPFAVDEVSSVNNLDGVANLKVYPNPFGDNLSIDIELESRSDLKLVVRNILGQVVFEKSHVDYQIHELIYTRDWSSGVYILEIIKAGERVEFRLVK